MPKPFKHLRHVSVEDANALTENWESPPWEPPTFRQLFFRPLNVVEEAVSGRRVRPASPAEHRDNFWKTWLEQARIARARRDHPWTARSTSPGYSDRSGGSSPGSSPSRRIGRATQRWLSKMERHLWPRMTHSSSPPPRQPASSRV